jgi:hypothetical protein
VDDTEIQPLEWVKSCYEGERKEAGGGINDSGFSSPNVTISDEPLNRLRN